MSAHAMLSPTEAVKARREAEAAVALRSTVPLPYPSQAAGLYPSIKALEEYLTSTADAVERLPLWSSTRAPQAELHATLERAKTLRDQWVTALEDRLGVLWLRSATTYATYSERLSLALAQRHVAELGCLFPRLRAEDPLAIETASFERLPPAQRNVRLHLSQHGYRYDEAADIDLTYDESVAAAAGGSAGGGGAGGPSFYGEGGGGGGDGGTDASPWMSTGSRSPDTASLGGTGPRNAPNRPDPNAPPGRLTRLCQRQMKERQVLRAAIREHTEHLARARTHDKERLSQRVQRSAFLLSQVTDTVERKIAAASMQHSGPVPEPPTIGRQSTMPSTHGGSRSGVSPGPPSVAGTAARSTREEPGAASKRPTGRSGRPSVKPATAAGSPDRPLGLGGGTVGAAVPAITTTLSGGAGSSGSIRGGGTQRAGAQSNHPLTPASNLPSGFLS